MNERERANERKRVLKEHLREPLLNELISGILSSGKMDIAYMDISTS
jgi:hypothetical protein